MSRLSNVRWKRALLIGTGGAVLGGVLLVGTAYALTDVPDPNDSATSAATIITFADGGEMGRVGQENRTPVELSAVPEHVQRAVLAAEDRGHYTDPGISPRGIGRALLTNVRGGGVEQGGSSITQQYAKNAFLTSERTYTRKVKEVLIALKMSQTVSKDQVLEDYLNTIFFGRGASGIEVASQNYFGKPVSALSTAEGAVLAASIRSPASYDPEKHPERAQERWRYVLDGMVSQGWLSAEERGTMTYPPVRPAAEAGRNNDLSGPKGHIMTLAIEELGRRGFSEAQLAAGGLRVQTSIRREAQAAAEAAVQEVLGGREGVHGALVSVKPTTGEIWAYYGGATGTGFDYASQGKGRPGGSSFKPYALAAALDEGMSLRSRFDGNSPKEFDGLEEPVRNFDRRSFGRVDLVEATRQSVNTAYVELAIELGPDKVREMAHRAGVSEAMPLANPDSGRSEAGIALGIYDVRPLDQAVGFGTFANGGIPVEPLLVKSVSQGDEVLFTAEITEGPRAFSEDVAADATFAMKEVVDRGTGTAARLRSGQPVAGKTGTTSDNTDAWFVGYTPQLSTAVWIGTGQNKTIELPGVNQVTGGSVSAGIWQSYATVAQRDMEIERFPARADVGSSRDAGGSSRTSTGGDSGSTTPRTRAPRPQRTAEPAPTTPPRTSAPVEEEPVEEQPAPAPEPPPTQAPAPQPTRPAAPQTSAPAAPAPSPTAGG